MLCKPHRYWLSRMNNQLQLVYSAVMPSTGTEHLFLHATNLARYKSCSQALPYTLPLRLNQNIWYMLVTHIKVEAKL